MWNLEVTIFCDALELLTKEKKNLLKEVQDILYQTDYYEEGIVEDLCKEYEDFGELYNKHMGEISIADYITLDETKNPSYNFGDTREASLGTIAFDIPCLFDEQAFLQDLVSKEGVDLE